MRKISIFSILYFLSPFLILAIDLPRLACGYTDPCGLSVAITVAFFALFYGIFLLFLLVFRFFLFKSFSFKTALSALVATLLGTLVLLFVFSWFNHAKITLGFFFGLTFPPSLIVVLIFGLFNILRKIFLRIQKNNLKKKAIYE